MIDTNQLRKSEPRSFFSGKNKIRRLSIEDKPTVFTDVYLEDTNIVVWQRTLSQDLKHEIDDFLSKNDSFQRNSSIPVNNINQSIQNFLGVSASPELSNDIAELVDMFCCLFDLSEAGLRLTVLDRAMCPRFHVDNVPCRLVTTYKGIATQWLPHQTVNRKKLGRGNNGLPDNESGLYSNESDVNQLKSGDVALLKGELWDGNKGAGLVHRSPALQDDERRLLLTMDFSM